MPTTGTVIIGGGQAGLAMSSCLSAFGIDHVVIERGQVAERWRTQSWDSLRLLTPNWMTRLPGFQYEGDEPDGFMSIRELIAFLEQYATVSRAPVLARTMVESVARSSDHFQVTTDRGVWLADSVVVATGYCDLPFVPAAREKLAAAVTQISSSQYRRPDDLPSGGVLIVGASASGVQLADEIQRSGRAVTLAVGRHARVPRRYRGRDILWWLDRLGSLKQPADAVHNIDISRRQPSLQLVGTSNSGSLDLATLHDAGVRVVGRLLDAAGTRVHLGDELIATTAAADIKMAELLGRIDRFIAESGFDAPPAPELRPTWPLGLETPDSVDLAAQGIRTLIWATGCRRAYPWLHVPVLDSRGEIRHQAGLTPVPGLYVLGMYFQRHRGSSLIDGVGSDALAIAHAITGSLTARAIAC